MKKINWIFVIVIILAVAGAVVLAKRASPAPASQVAANTSDLPGLQIGAAPWIAEISNLRARLNKINLPALSAEGTALHTHQHLDIFIDGQAVAIPAGIGINNAARFISPIHVHDDTGIIHVESPTIQTFTLGQFFDIWGVRFTKDSIGGYSNQGGKILKMFVNGALYSGDPRMLALDVHQEIVITYGTDAELPNPMPSSYTFPVGF